ncbi:thioesterase superfamily protein [Murinocardiopsis flavida]|uniref:Thioesterase superfamily protein n=1 Tax=Murinocardiopsis flavida TaxID=645275 RepID=A0A2P8D955_9ACTN|nr:thioesterase family protein [Murinocardiopsis flavida]PSK93754.1 thioesterase superfamily protein [Murinocardiopsis flavida]
MNTGPQAREGYYERIDEHRYKPTAHTGGGWDPTEQHFGPLGGLTAHAIDRHRSRATGTDSDTGSGGSGSGKALSRISFDILGRLALQECRIEVETTRPGRTIELVEATVLIAERPVVRARAWYLATGDTAAVEGGAPAPLTPPAQCPLWPMTSMWPGGYIASLEVRPLDAPRHGRATAWIRSPLDLVAGESAGHEAAYIAHVDTANGLAARQPPAEWMFPNLDLTVHLYRRPEGPWTGLDTTAVFGPNGQGLTSTVLHDATGPVGQAQQTLTVRPSPNGR